jgi:solute carrier family 25 carnitine/acylcarnitine transporter 20/29
MQAKNENNKNYSGIIRPLKTVYHSEGIKPLFRGLGATAIRAFPTNAVTFYTVILVKTYLDSYA